MMRKDLRKHAVGIEKKQCRNSPKNQAFEKKHSTYLEF